MPEINRSRLADVLAAEESRFYKSSPKSFELYQNMALISPDTTDHDVGYHTQVFRDE